MSKAQLEQIRAHHENFRAQVAAVGEALRGRAMPEPTEELFSQFERTGNRLLYENVYFGRRRFLTVFGLLGDWYRRPEDIRKLAEVLEDICGEETWALPAHVDRSQSGWQRTVDLFAAETGQTLAQILCALDEELPAALAWKVRDMVIDRVLNAYLERPRGGWGWERAHNNWAAVCGGCVGSAALYLLDDFPEKQWEIVGRVCEAFSYYWEGMYEDGVCPEGLGYFTYGMTYYTGFARLLYEHSGGVVDMMDVEKVHQVAKFQQRCYFPGGRTVSFSDGGQKEGFRLGLTCYLAGTVAGVEIPDISAAMDFAGDPCYRYLPNWQDDRWVKEYLERGGPGCCEDGKGREEWFTFFPEAQWAIWKQGGIGVALKGGHNGESHNHNDVGSFLIVAEGEVFLTDLGCGEYTREYFNDRTRYGILCNRSAGHSVPLIDGGEQEAGRAFGADSFVSRVPGCVEMEFARAYRAEPQFSLCRRLDWRQGMEDIVVTDNCCSDDTAVKMEENLVTQIEPMVTGGRIVLNGEKGSLEIVIAGADGDIRVIKENFRSHRGEDEAVWRLCWPVALRNGERRCELRCRYVGRPT